MNPTSPLLTLQGVSKHYTDAGSQRWVLQEISLNIHRGEWLALVGRSGSGKSTLLHLMGGLDKPSGGSIITHTGLDLARAPEGQVTRWRLAQVGFVFQFFNLVPTLTAAENISLPLELLRWGKKAVTERVDELLTAVGLGHRSRAFPEQLSGGEQQRIAIARALAARPALLLADEPTGNLDEDTAEQVVALLRQMCHTQGAALVTVTHSPALAAQASRTLALHHGQLAPQLAQITL